MSSVDLGGSIIACSTHGCQVVLVLVRVPKIRKFDVQRISRLNKDVGRLYVTMGDRILALMEVPQCRKTLAKNPQCLLG